MNAHLPTQQPTGSFFCVGLSGFLLGTASVALWPGIGAVVTFWFYLSLAGIAGLFLAVIAGAIME